MRGRIAQRRLVAFDGGAHPAAAGADRLATAHGARGEGPASSGPPDDAPEAEIDGPAGLDRERAADQHVLHPLG